MSTENTREQKLKVTGMTCGHCEMSVTNKLKALQGVQNATANKDENSATVTYDPAQVSPEDFIEALKETPYSASLAE